MISYFYFSVSICAICVVRIPLQCSTPLRNIANLDFLFLKGFHSELHQFWTRVQLYSLLTFTLPLLLSSSTPQDRLKFLVSSHSGCLSVIAVSILLESAIGPINSKQIQVLDLKLENHLLLPVLLTLSQTGLILMDQRQSSGHRQSFRRNQNNCRLRPHNCH